MLLKVLALALAIAAASAASVVKVTVPVSGAVNFASPNYPAKYSDSDYVTYLITGPVGLGLQFDALAFSTETGTYDTLRFSELVNGVQVALGTAFSGANGPRKLRSATNQVTAIWKTDSSISSTGFSIVVRVPLCAVGLNSCKNDETVCIRPNQVCDGVADCPDAVDENCPTGCGIPVNSPNVLVRSGLSQLIAALTSPSWKIVGGTEATPHSWPWQVGMLTSSGSQLCGGSILSNKWIMTAAHCCVARAAVPASYKVRIGAHNLFGSEASAVTLSLSRVVVHPAYRASPAAHNDFCLLKVADNDEIVFSPEVSPVCLPDETDGQVGETCWVTGWGSEGQSRGNFDEFVKSIIAAEEGVVPKPVVTSDARLGQALRQVDVKVTSVAKCSAAYPSIITPEMMCADNTGKDSCQGDSGGPLVCQKAPVAGVAQPFKLAGVVSWGIGCARLGYPGVYARTTTALDWIAETIYE